MESQEQKWSLDVRIFAFTALFSIVGLIATQLTKVNPGLMPMIGSIVMIGAGALVVFRSLGKRWLGVLVLTIGATSEIVGLYTGWPFGQYSYTDKWAPVLPLPLEGGYFPLLLPLAWLMVVGGAFSSLRCYTDARLTLVLGTAATATVIDFFMEHVMVKQLGYWKWLDASKSVFPGGAPILNSIGWFAVSAVAALILSTDTKPKQQAKDSLVMLVLYCGFMFAVFLIVQNR